MEVVLLDCSWYGNEYDPASDALLVGALNRLGVVSRILSLSRGQRPHISAPRVWLRYDLRSPEDLAWVVECALRLQLSGVTLFPSPQTILVCEDKWLTDLALRRNNLPIPDTWLAGQMPDGPFPMILKPRVCWGGNNSRVIHGARDMNARDAMNDHFVAQPFIPHQKTWIAAIANRQPIACIEERIMGDGMTWRAGTVPFRDNMVELACKALEAVNLVTGTVDLIETPDGMQILEVNSAPRLTYPHLQGLDLAGPMACAVMERWSNAE